MAPSSLGALLLLISLFASPAVDAGVATKEAPIGRQSSAQLQATNLRVGQRTIGSSIFSQLGLQAILQSKDPKQFHDYMIRLADHLGLRVVNDEFLQLTAPYFNGDCAAFDFDGLVGALHRGVKPSKCMDAWVAPKTGSQAQQLARADLSRPHPLRAVGNVAVKVAQTAERAGDTIVKTMAQAAGADLSAITTVAMSKLNKAIDDDTASFDVAVKAGIGQVGWEAIMNVTASRAGALQIYAKRVVYKLDKVLVRDEAIFKSALAFFDCNHDEGTPFKDFVVFMHTLVKKNDTCGGLFAAADVDEA